LLVSECCVALELVASEWLERGAGTVPDLCADLGRDMPDGSHVANVGRYSVGAVPGGRVLVCTAVLAGCLVRFPSLNVVVT